MNEMDEVVAEFLVECQENLEQYDRDLLALEENPGAQDVLASIFRTVHTIKGTCGFLGFAHLEGVTHVAENLLGKLRDGELAVTPRIATALLTTGDAIREMLAAVAATGTDGDEEYAALVNALTALHDEEQPVEALDDLVPAREQSGQDTGDDPGRGVAPDSSIRVDVGLLDTLMNLVGELVLVRNQVIQLTTDRSEAAFVTASQRLNLITTELQEGVMKTRMQPIGNVWNRFPRIVRDLALACGKRVRVDMEGKETELDKTLLEAIKDPLTHLVRNTVDHGIETPEARLAAGKPEEGRLVLRAYHEGGQVNIELTDDGRGIDPAAVRDKALAKGIVSPDQAARMNERELVNLIFTPGFSTAEQVTNVSGRGVGMDVVRTNIERVGGTVDLRSEPGRGTAIKIKIPLTLAIIPALVVTCGGDRYAIPQVSLLELVRLDGEQADAQIDQVLGSPVYRLRGELLPLVYLSEELGVTPRADDAVHIVVLKADDRQFGLVVDGITDTEEIVVKPLGRHLQGIAAFAGTTIMGDGSVALILDVLGLAQQTSVVGEVREGRGAQLADEGEDRRDDTQTLLVCDVGDQRVALPLALVTRLEEFSAGDLERAAGRPVIQYRDSLLPLVWLADHLGERRTDTDLLSALVYDTPTGGVGLVVDRIVDIVEEDVTGRRPSDRDGIEFSGVVGRRATDMLDIDALLAVADPALASGVQTASGV